MNVSQTYISELEQISKDVKSSFSGLSKEVLYQKPDSKNWSIAENLAHIIVLNSSYFPIFQRLKNGNLNNAFVSKISFFPKVIGDMIFKSVSDGGKRKVKTFPLWEPKTSLDQKEDILDKFIEHQKELSTWIDDLQPFLEQRTIIHSPANKLIVYSLNKAFEIIIAHEKRHFDQAKNVLNQI
ncbi:DinB family protein [Belliella aquatica]|uniref:DinB-like domain-containing protein n=1 Tax=Belliella aquatica TaxID=1323734 RepID=A0ABQ1N137_9BACT|nr:DinB family protein [Belliella aquatica]MCH7406763.1 DinB family protein [Belliella aquatica]GGC48680.1 hypothetical protein GCM10010993_28930 [Belliella aquatica]